MVSTDARGPGGTAKFCARSAQVVGSLAVGVLQGLLHGIKIRRSGPLSVAAGQLPSMPVVRRQVGGLRDTNPGTALLDGIGIEKDGFIFSFMHQPGNAGGTFIILNAPHLSAKPVVTVSPPQGFVSVSTARGYLPA